jgi:hypothetical protein
VKALFTAESIAPSGTEVNVLVWALGASIIWAFDFDGLSMRSYALITPQKPFLLGFYFMFGVRFP